MEKRDIQEAPSSSYALDRILRTYRIEDFTNRLYG